VCARVQVITVADFHPQQSHTFAFATSKGAIRLADLRASALADNSCKAFEEARMRAQAVCLSPHAAAGLGQRQAC
jgi:hypothetical protein